MTTSRASPQWLFLQASGDFYSLSASRSRIISNSYITSLIPPITHSGSCADQNQTGTVGLMTSPPSLRGKKKQSLIILPSIRLCFPWQCCLEKHLGTPQTWLPRILESCHPKKLPAFLRAGFLGAIIPTALLHDWMLSSQTKPLYSWQRSLT